MQYAQSPRSIQRILIIALLGVCIFAAGLVVAPATAAAHHDTVDGVPRVGTYTDYIPDWTSSGWTRHGSNCGAGGCGDDFWVTTKKGATAEWYLPNMQGVYTFGWTLGKNFRIDGINGYRATGTVKWTIWEWREGSSSYKKVRTFTPGSQRDRLGWWTYSQTRIELDGAVKIRAEAQESGKRVGVQHVRLNHVDVLPEHLDLVKDMCVDGDDRLQERLESIATYTGLTVAVISTFVLPGIGHAALAAKLAAAGVAASIAAQATEELMDLLFDRERRKEGYCGVFHADWWWQGYSKFSDDIAEFSNDAREYATLGCTYLPTRRTPTSVGTAPCIQPNR